MAGSTGVCPRGRFGKKGPPHNLGVPIGTSQKRPQGYREKTSGGPEPLIKGPRHPRREKNRGGAHAGKKHAGTEDTG